MKKFSILVEYNSYLKTYDELTNYLLSIKGITKALASEKNNLLYIDTEYDEKLINDEIIKYEILAFLDLLNRPVIYGFSRYPNEDDVNILTLNYTVCCEFCFGNIIYYLIDTKGIERVDSNFFQVYFNKEGRIHDYIISIYYNPKVLKEEQLAELIKKIDIYG